MLTLAQTLQGLDLGFLRIIAHHWGIELKAPDAASARAALLDAILAPGLATEILETLRQDAQEALIALAQNGGKMTWSQFTRRFGEVRLMGAGKRDRERPDLTPKSPAEVLWYRAWVGQAFLVEGTETPEEYAYIPSELLDVIPVPALVGAGRLGRAALPAEYADIKPASDRILDDATTLLAALRNGWKLADIPATFSSIPREPLMSLCQAAGLVTAKGQVVAEAARHFLESPRNKALAFLVQSWQVSNTFNELHLLPGLICEGTWQNNPLATRQQVLSWLKELPQNKWWSLDSFISAIKDQEPDFQRPAGDYESWLIRQKESTEFLHGFSSWDAVDGALIRFIITGPLHWLGWMDLAETTGKPEVTAFHPSRRATAFWNDQVPDFADKEDQPVLLSSDATIRVQPLSPRSVRYQIARFGEWVRSNEREHIYRLTPASLEAAQKQGLKITHLLTLLKRHSGGPIPPSVIQALERWEASGVQVKLESSTLLRSATPDALVALRASRAARYIVEGLTPTTALIRPGSEQAVLTVLAELGYLGVWVANTSKE